MRHNIYILLTVVFITLFSLFKNSTYAHNGTHSHNEKNVVNITKNGFEPNSISISKDSSVTFINKDSVSHWPASNPHPTHSNYYEFDSGKEILPGEHWTFQPQKKGEWNYHDHLYPHKEGLLIVFDEEKLIELEKTKNNSNWFVQNFYILNLLRYRITQIFKIIIPIQSPTHNRYVNNQASFLELDDSSKIKVIDKIIHEKGFEPTWEFILSVYKDNRDARAISNAHNLAHHFGEKLYEMEGNKGLKICTYEFVYGCFHGFTTVALADNLDNIPALVDSCDSLEEIGSKRWGTCIHGIGHGIATYYQTEDLPNALKVCDDLERGTEYCYGGVFMEFSSTSGKDFYKKEDPLYPCNSVDDKYKKACILNQTGVMVVRLGLSNNELTETCLSSNDDILRYYCVESIGWDIGTKTEASEETIKAWCSVFEQEEQYNHCIIAAAAGMIFQQFDNWSEVSDNLCTDLGNEARLECFDRVEQSKVNWIETPDHIM